MVLMIVMIVFGCVMAYAVLMAHDVLISKLIDMGFDAGQGTAWDSTHELSIQTSMLYLICALPPVLGIAQFLLIVTRRTRRDDYAMQTDQQMYYQDE